MTVCIILCMQKFLVHALEIISSDQHNKQWHNLIAVTTECICIVFDDRKVVIESGWVSHQYSGCPVSHLFKRSSAIPKQLERSLWRICP